ncbi:hypothetical protein M3J09_010874 [Ascochyta lentis]
MTYTLCTVALSDLEELVRHCDHPAMQENPLHLTMFPNASQESSEEEIMWHVSSFRESFEKTPGAYFRKVCFNDGTPVGFALWTVDQACPGLHIGLKDSRPEAPVPRSLDICAWREISRKLLAEKRRVLEGLENVWRLNVLSVSPAHQHQGCGSMLLAWGCEQADRYSRTSFVMASPAAVNLYEYFGFRIMGEVATSHGTFRSMLREPKI